MPFTLLNFAALPEPQPVLESDPVPDSINAPLPRRRSGSSIVVIDGDDLKPCLPDDYISSQHYRQHSGDIKEIDQEMLTMLSVNQDNGPHREMAVDCPDTFIARNKTPPRYPPPRPPQHQQQLPFKSASTHNTQQQIQSQQQQIQSQQQQQQLGKQQTQSVNQNSIATITTTATTTATKTTTTLNSLEKLKYITSNNPNGGSIAHPLHSDELEIMADGLYRKGSSSHSSSYDEALSKKSSESFDSISYNNLQNNNNNSNNSNNNMSTSTTTTTSSASPIKQTNGGIGAMQRACGDGSLNSTRSSSSSTAIADDVVGIAPPEYTELREFSNSNKNISCNFPTHVVKHRELPVDVPDSFIEIIKTTPRYPPPPHLSSLSSQLSNSSASTANTALSNINSSLASTNRVSHVTPSASDNFNGITSLGAGTNSAMGLLTTTFSNLEQFAPTLQQQQQLQQTTPKLKQLGKQKSSLSTSSCGSLEDVQKCGLQFANTAVRQQAQPQVPTATMDGDNVSKMSSQILTTKHNNDEVGFLFVNLL
ncbi:myosin-G heavy chain-like [Teleopsis dalmanni]|uniref:myosin-G heavy chain-like n=1 Tax=Teleopsis dalmanni TaxID=139649 RepID=UPI0018CD733C|nr:myosin-G heavy chain-like [Teleopsis dalmanni]